MKTLGICGHFGSYENINGQMVKTKILTEELTKHFGSREIALVDTYGWKKHPFSLFFSCVKLTFKCRNILIMPAGGGNKGPCSSFCRTLLCFKKKAPFFYYWRLAAFIPFGKSMDD